MDKKEYIERQDVLDKMLSEMVGTGYQSRAMGVIKDAPTADVVPRSEVDGFPCIAYNKKHERYQVIHKGKDGRIFASKFYYARKDAEKALAKLKKKHLSDF